MPSNLCIRAELCDLPSIVEFSPPDWASAQVEFEILGGARRPKRRLFGLAQGIGQRHIGINLDLGSGIGIEG